MIEAKWRQLLRSERCRGLIYHNISCKTNMRISDCVKKTSWLVVWTWDHGSGQFWVNKGAPEILVIKKFCDRFGTIRERGLSGRAELIGIKEDLKTRAFHWLPRDHCEPIGRAIFRGTLVSDLYNIICSMIVNNGFYEWLDSPYRMHYCIVHIIYLCFNKVDWLIDW